MLRPDACHLNEVVGLMVVVLCCVVVPEVWVFQHGGLLEQKSGEDLAKHPLLSSLLHFKGSPVLPLGEHRNLYEIVE